MDNQRIGDFIALLRKEKGLTQSELASKLNITDKAISKWETGRGCPDISLLDDLSKMLDVSVSEILKGKRLEKEEIVENKEMLAGMTYAEINTREKYKLIINTILVIIISFVMILLLFFNIRNVYKTYKKYYTSFTFNTYGVEDFLSIFDIDKKIDLVITNQGRYTKDEYANILYIVKEINNNSDAKNDKESFKRCYYTYDDIYKNAEILGYPKTLDTNIIYDILIKYDESKKERKEYYQDTINSASELIVKLSRQLSGSYLYNNSFYEFNYYYDFYDLGSIAHDLLYKKYEAYTVILDDIIEVGEIHE